LSPGGWLELQETDSPICCDDDSFLESSPLFQWSIAVNEGFKAAGRELTMGPKLKDWMTQAGFTQVTEMTYKWPINDWPKDKTYKTIGLWSRENTLGLLQAVAMAPLTRFLGWSMQEVEVLLAGARKDLADRRIHAYWNM
jgi:hypothetical protein